MRFRRSGRPAHSRSSKAARSPGSAMAMTAANRSSSFIGLVLRLTQRNRRAKGAVAVERILYSFSENSKFRHEWHEVIRNRNRQNRIDKSRPPWDKDW